VDLVAEAGAERNRAEKLLEDAQIKLSVVVSDLFGMSGRAMMAALIAGHRDPHALADLARSSLRGKIPALAEALTGRFTDHHAFLLGKMIARVEAIEADIREVDTRIEQQLAPFAPAVARLLEIPGIGPAAAATIIAEIGVDMTRFPTPAHLAGWARFAPGVNESAGRRRGNASTGHGNRYLARVLGQIAVTAARTHTFLGERYRRVARRRGAKRAIVAVGRSALTIVWHLLSDASSRFHDLGADFYLNHTNTERRKNNHIRQLEALGFHVTVELAA
jgi:transposase